MAKKLKITESQLKMLVENTKKSVETKDVVTPTKENLPQVNETMEKIKSEFKRYL
jgi:hypothetical protein